MYIHSFSAVLLGKAEMVAGHSHTVQAHGSTRTCRVIVKNHGSLTNAKQCLNKMDRNKSVGCDGIHP